MSEILVIDDNRNLRMGLAANLRRAGFDVEIASNGKEGVMLAREIHPELILCDIRMPGMDGLEVKKALNSEEATADIPFIFLSAISAPLFKSAGLRAGADDYIAKPFEMDELIARIQAILRREARIEFRLKYDVEQLLQNLGTSLPIHTNHIFRTYLGILMLSLESVKNNLPDSNPNLDVASNCVYQLRKTVNDLIWLNELDLGRSETIGQRLDPDLSFVLPIHELMEIWKEKKLQLDVHIDDDIVFFVPEHSFAQSVCHLVDNACKFSPVGSKVDVRLERSGPHGCKVTVQDQGLGIPTDQRELVFDRFYQIQNEESLPQNHGLGLGLYLARSFARSRGGDVCMLDSTLGCRVEMILKQ